MRVIVCGGRDYQDQDHVYQMLNELNAGSPITFLFHGNAKGADHLADLWGHRAKLRQDIKIVPVPAKWKKYGSAAGPIRNKAMLGHGINLVVAFPGGRGTKNMIKQAKAANVDVWEVPPFYKREG